MLGLTSRFVLAAQFLGVIGAQAPPSPANVLRAEVAIAVNTAGRASVTARYEFAGNPGALSFELLQQPCATVGPVQLESNGMATAYARDVVEPWLRLHDTSAVDPGRTSTRYRAVYDVDVAGRDAGIPLLVPMAVLRGSRRGEPVVRLTLRLPAGARVMLPRMHAADNESWSATMAALPSAVRVRLTNASECDSAARGPGDSGRFTLIFWSLVATLALWVPLYMWWANRQREAA